MVQEHNELRRCLRAFFTHRKLFVLERPTADKNLARLEEVREDELQPRFRQQADAFCQHIWEKAPVKELPGGRRVTGISEWQSMRMVWHTGDVCGCDVSQRWCLPQCWLPWWRNMWLPL